MIEDYPESNIFSDNAFSIEDDDECFIDDENFIEDLPADRRRKKTRRTM